MTVKVLSAVGLIGVSFTACSMLGTGGPIYHGQVQDQTVHARAAYHHPHGSFYNVPERQADYQYAQPHNMAPPPVYHRGKSIDRGLILHNTRPILEGRGSQTKREVIAIVVLG